MNKLLMFDLDTVLKPKGGGKFIGHPQDQQIVEGAIAGQILKRSLLGAVRSLRG